MTEGIAVLIGVIFPGQGSQFVGMVDAWTSHALGAELNDEADSVLGADLGELTRDEEALKRTDVVQPATLLCDVIAFRLLEGAGVETTVAAGHSLGEYAALTAAGVLTFAEAMEAVRVRSLAMQAASNSGEGAMTAIVGMSIDDAAAVCEEAAQGDVLLVANENSPMQTVLSGSEAAIERAEELAKQRKARAMRLPVAGAFHSPLMEPARAEVQRAIDALPFRPGRFPVVPNATGQPTSDPLVLQDALRRHLVSPVHWVATMAAMVDLGVDRVLEAGPGDVLTRLGKRCAPKLPITAIRSPDDVVALAAEPKVHP